MVKNVAFLAALTVFLFAAWLAGELAFLARFKGLLFRRHGLAIAVATLLLYLDLVAVFYACARWLFLRDTGRKLQHLDRQLGTPDTALDDLRERLDS